MDLLLVHYKTTIPQFKSYSEIAIISFMLIINFLNFAFSLFIFVVPI